MVSPDSEYGTVAGCCRNGSELSHFVKCREFLDDLKSSLPPKRAVLEGVGELKNAPSYLLVIETNLCLIVKYKSFMK